MAKCIGCGKPDAEYTHIDGGKICNDCIDKYFTCRDCGLAFDRDDYERGDQGNGYCKTCASEH